MTDPAGAKLRTKDSRRISRLTAGYWKEVAAELDMDGEAIDNIAKSSSEYPEAKDKAFRMLEDLREQGCTKRKLADALRSLGKAAHADEVLPSQPPPNGNPPGNLRATNEPTHQPPLGTSTGRDRQSATLPPVFISYQWDIQDLVRALKRKLDESGVHCWMDEGQMGGGDALYTKIDAGIRAAKVFIACVTEKYRISDNCQKEVTLADSLKKSIIPLRFDRSDWPPLGQMSPIFAKLLYINMADPSGTIPDQKFQELLKQVHQRLEEDFD